METDRSIKRLRDSERVGAYLSREHGEGGSFVWQMHVDMVMLLAALKVVLVVGCGAAPGGCKPCGRTCGKKFKS